MRKIFLILLPILISVTIFGQTSYSKKGVKNGQDVSFATIAGTSTITIGTATNTVTIDNINSLRMNGTATVWDDLQFPFATGFSGGGSPNPALDTVLMAYTFTVDSSGSTQCMQYMNVQMPHSWKIGSAVHPHVHYLHQTAVGAPKFIVRYRWINITGAPTAWSWLRLETTSGTTDNTHQLVDDAADTGISAAGITGVSAILQCRIYLRTTPANVKAFQFDCHFEKDSEGSNSELIK